MNNTFNDTEKSTHFDFERFVAYVIGLTCSLLAVVANTLVLVILRRKKQQIKPFDLIIASLSFTDLLTSICCTIYVGYEIAFLFIIAKDAQTYKPISEIASNVSGIFFILSLLHVLLITFLRFCAIFWPLKFRQFATKALSKVLIALIWTMTVGASLMFAMAENASNTTAVIIFATGGLVGFAYIMIAIKICILVKKKQFVWNKEHRVLLNSFGVTISLFACLLPFAFHETSNEHISEEFVNSLLSINFLIDPLLYFYFSYWLSKRDEYNNNNII